MDTCGHVMRGGTCNLDAGHPGRHTTVGWCCDGCGKMRRSYPAARHPEAGIYCFMCIEVAGREERDMYYAEYQSYAGSYAGRMADYRRDNPSLR